ncbi:MAG: hypothetical protein HY928_10295, partial [Elusimicrobia bacterium]|nr:hypothetical protein [Elusimicrobiota bacterium]
ALVDGELDGAIKKGDSVLVDFDGTKLVVRKSDEGKTTKLGGWALGAAALGLAALPAGASLALAVAGIAAAVGYAAWRVASSYSGPHGRAQAPPLARVWAVRAVVMTAAFLAADWALKALFFGSGLFVFHHIVPTRALIMAAAVPLNLAFGAWMLSLGHSKAAPLEKLRKFRERHPVLGAVAYGLLQVLAFPFTINDQRYAGDLAAKHPAVAKALGVFVVAAAAVLAGTLGNGLEGLVNAKVVDFIPVGHGRANLADFLVFLGIPFAWMTLDFFGAARKAVAARKPAVMNFAKYYALPVLGMLTFLLASSAGYAAIPLPAIYAAFFSTLFGVGILGANVFVQRRLAEFNGSLQDGVFQPMPAKPAFSAGYRLRRAAAALLASLAALPFVGKVVSQPKLSDKDYAALVERYRGRLPKVVITDYDDTFMDNSDGRGLVISDARLKLLEDLKAAGVRVAFATNRPLTGGSYAMSAMLVERMSPELRRDFILSTGGGAEVFKFSSKGELPETPYFSGPAISEAERAVVGGIIAAESAKLGVDMAHARSDTKPYEHAFMYSMGLNAEKKAAMPEAEWKAAVAERNRRLTAVFAALEKGLKKEGLEFAATLKFPPRDELEPYIRLSKSTKSFAVKAILEVVEAEGRRVDAEDVLMLGDDFTVPGYDSAMPKALPGGTAVAVGSAADARIGNVHLLGGGPDATEKFLRDILKK